MATHEKRQPNVSCRNDELIKPSLSDVYIAYNGKLQKYCKSNLAVAEVPGRLHDIWVKVFAKWDTFSYRDETSLRNWLYTIAHNVINDFYRKQHRAKDKSQRPWNVVSLNQDVILADGSSSELIETVAADDLDYDDLFELGDVLKVAEQVLTQTELELLEARLFGRPLPAERSANWVNVTWHRLQQKLIKAYARLHNANIEEN